MALAGCAPPAQETPPALPKLARATTPTMSGKVTSDGALSTSRVAGTSPAADFAALHAAHANAITRANGTPLSAAARIQLPNALEHHGNLYALVSVSLLHGEASNATMGDDFDPHAEPNAAKQVPDADTRKLLDRAMPILENVGGALRGAAALDLGAPTCVQCHADGRNVSAALVYRFQELADD